MKSEKEAIAALDILRQSTLHDQAVKARLKNESYLRNLMKELNVVVVLHQMHVIYLVNGELILILRE